MYETENCTASEWKSFKDDILIKGKALIQKYQHFESASIEFSTKLIPTLQMLGTINLGYFIDLSQLIRTKMTSIVSSLNSVSNTVASGDRTFWNILNYLTAAEAKFVTNMWRAMQENRFLEPECDEFIVAQFSKMLDSFNDEMKGCYSEPFNTSPIHSELRTAFYSWYVKISQLDACVRGVTQLSSVQVKQNAIGCVINVSEKSFG